MLRILIHNLVDLAGLLHDPPRKLNKDQLLQQFCSGLADRGGFDWGVPLENPQPEPVPNFSAQAGEEDQEPTPKTILDSSERAVEADNAQSSFLFLPIEAKSIPAEHSSSDVTAEFIQTMQLRQRDPIQPPGEAHCPSCNAILDLDGLCLPCIDSFINSDASVDHSIEWQSQSERAA